MVRIGQNWADFVRICQNQSNSSELDIIGHNSSYWSVLVRIIQNCSKLVKIGQHWSKLIKLDKGVNPMHPFNKGINKRGNKGFKAPFKAGGLSHPRPPSPKRSTHTQVWYQHIRVKKRSTFKRSLLGTDASKWRLADRDKIKKSRRRSEQGSRRVLTTSQNQVVRQNMGAH